MLPTLLVPESRVDEVSDFCEKQGIDFDYFDSNVNPQIAYLVFKEAKDCDKARHYLDKIDFPPMDHCLGWFEETVHKILKERDMNVENFTEWHSGQTYAIDEVTGKSVIYPCDVHQYLHNGGPKAPITD